MASSMNKKMNKKRIGKFLALGLALATSGCFEQGDLGSLLSQVTTNPSGTPSSLPSNLPSPLPQGILQKAKQLGVPGEWTFGASVVAVRDGNIIISGNTSGALPSNVLSGNTDIFISQINVKTGAFSQTRQIGSVNSDTYVNSSASDSFGNIYVVGVTTGNLGGNTINGPNNLFLTKFDSSGVLKWIKLYGTGNNAAGFAVATFSNRYIYTIGDVARMILLNQYDVDGNLLWSKEFGNTSCSSSGQAVAVDGDNNVYIAGRTACQVTGTSFKDGGGYKMYVAKIDSSGTMKWIRTLGETGNFGDGTQGLTIALDSSKNVYVGGRGRGGFLSKYRASGDSVWTVSVGQSTAVKGLVVDALNNFFLIGDMSNQHGSTPDSFVSQYDADGQQKWLQVLSDPSSNSSIELKSITMTTDGKIAVAGSATVSRGTQNAVIFILNPDGSYFWN